MPEEIVSGEKARDVKAAESILRQNRRDAYAELQKHLQEVYLADVRRSEQEQLDALKPAKDEAEQKARDELRRIFDAYASDRSQRVTRLALIAGFPDPDPRSLRQPVSDAKVVRQRAAEARRLRSEIANLDADYETAIRRLLANLGQDLEAALTNIKVNVEDARVRAEERARKDAASQVRTLEANLGQSLVAKGDTRLPALPAKSFAASAQAGVIEQPKVQPDIEGKNLEARMKRLRSELTIWLAVNGYREASDAAHGQDRTTEFSQWRRSHHLGL